jgi:hypothetical protein
MEQTSLKNNLLLIKVKKPPIIIITVLFIFIILFFLFPLSWLVSLIMGNQFSPASLIFPAIFSFSGIYLLRLTLWNTYGEEKICFNPNQISYQASYGWFKANLKEMSASNFHCAITPHPSGENIGTLTISDGTTEINSVIPLQTTMLEELIVKIKNLNS